MSLRNRPVIKAFRTPSNVEWDVPQATLSKWTPYAKAEDAPGTISMFEGIGEQWDGTGITSKRIAAALRNIGERDVIVSINSPGGDFFEGISIYNLLREHPAKVTVRVPGLAASAASIIAMAGDEIQVAKAGFLMIHNSWSVVMGNRHDLEDAIAILEPFDAAMAQVYADRSGAPLSKIEKMMDKDTWLSGVAAVDLGLADSLLPADAEVPQEDIKSEKTIRRIERALAAQGLSRAQRRDMINELLESAVAIPVPHAVAADAELEELKNFLTSIKGK